MRKWVLRRMEREPRTQRMWQILPGKMRVSNASSLSDGSSFHFVLSLVGQLAFLMATVASRPIPPNCAQQIHAISNTVEAPFSWFHNSVVFSRIRI